MRNNKMLLVMLVVSSALVACFGGFLKYGVLKPLGIVREESVIAMPFLFAADDMLSYEVKGAYKRTQLQQSELPEVTVSVTEPVVTETKITEESLPTQTEMPTQPTEPPATEPAPVYLAVEESWFDDVLFIGDSRTVGLRDYARLGDADYFCKVGMSVFNVMEWETFDEDFTNKTLDKVLADKTYGKIYIHFGLNEVGQDKNEIKSKYGELLDMIRLYQPDAKIIIQAMMSATRGKTENQYFSLENILAVNEMIRNLADEQGLFYENVNSWVADEEGYMYDELSFDGCHLYGTGYLDWRQWIWDNAGWYGIP